MRLSPCLNLCVSCFCPILFNVLFVRILTMAKTDAVSPSNGENHDGKYPASKVSDKPEFVNKIPSMSIVSGKDAVMRCSVKNLGNNVISWHHLESNSDLTVNKQVLTSNPRIKIKQDDDNWLLIINNVSLQDRGFYVCRINWQEPNSQLAYLNVVESPKFDESSFRSGQEVTVHEYENLTLSCKASGDPQPEIEWRREDGRSIVNSNPNQASEDQAFRARKRIFGEQIHFRPVTRWSMGSYLCIAANGVPPSISRRIMITVYFPPVIRIPSQSEIASIGGDVSLRCMVESSPNANQWWIHPNGSQIVNKPAKYTLNSVETYHFKKMHTFTILNALLKDAGEYVCHVNNSIGQAKSSISLQVREEFANQNYDNEEFGTRKYRTSTSKDDLFDPKAPIFEADEFYREKTIKRSKSWAIKARPLQSLLIPFTFALDAFLYQFDL